MTCSACSLKRKFYDQKLISGRVNTAWAQNLPKNRSRGACGSRNFSSATVMQAGLKSQGSIKLVLVGDVHGQWDPILDEAALRLLNPDAAIFVGDFGNEVVDIVKQIANAKVSKAVMLGNHDAWGPLHGSENTERVDLQIEALGLDYIGYAANQFLTSLGTKFSVVGCRPFSSGKPKVPPFTKARHNVNNLDESAAKIATIIEQQPPGQPIILVGHNGPAGLGSSRHDPCGKDFSRREGDHGDIDLAKALQMSASNDNIALVTFGHMHQQLQDASAPSERRWTKEQRNMVDICPTTGRVYLNCAVVPRHRVINGEKAAHFVVVSILGSVVMDAQNVWVADSDQPYVIGVEKLIRSRTTGQQGIVRSFFKAYEGVWSPEIPLGTALANAVSTTPADQATV